MFERIKKYLVDNKKSLYLKLSVFILALLIIGIFYGNFILAKNMVADLINEEKTAHAQEVCATLDEINQEINFFAGQISQLKNQRNYLDKNQKKEIIQDLRKLEGHVRKIDLAYLGFYNDLSLKFFSFEKEAPVDNLFSQIKNLPIYGYRAVEAMENSLSSDYITRSQKDVLQIEFNELREKIKSVNDSSGMCALSF
jgi:cell division protein FtsB